MPAKFDHPLPLPNPADWFTPNGAADALDVHVMTVYRLARQGKIQTYRAVGDGATPMYWRAEILQYAEARKIVNRR